MPFHKKQPPVERLQKILAQAGIASRRKAEEMIKNGRVILNGKKAKLGDKANPNFDKIQIDGQLLQHAEEIRYIRLNKPRGYITALSDDRGRPVVSDLINSISERIYPVGRLDYDSEGVLLLTNDGTLAHQLTHPSYKVPRTYEVKVKGNPKSELLRQLELGIKLDDGIAQALHVERIRPTPGGHSWIEIVLTEGRNREVKRMFDAIRHPVLRLKRTKYANLHVDDLKPGEFRNLSVNELKALRSYIVEIDT